MRRTRLTALIIPWTLLATPTSGRTQDAEPAASEWQFGVHAVDWPVVEQLKDSVREYRDAGAIGRYELRVRTNGSRYDAVVIAEIVDALRLAELRELEAPGRPLRYHSPERSSR
ncbi:MAG: hypothetical protein ACRELU_05160 [Gemmatimonadota bacterium]